LTTIRDAFSHEMQARLDAAMQAEAKDEQRAYVGASAIGENCLRKVQLDVWEAFGGEKINRAPLTGKTLRVFERGNTFESLSREWLRQAGVEIAKSTEFSELSGKFRGHCDGVVVAGVERTPCVWEHKVVGARTWREISAKGVAKARPQYAMQIALYQYHLDLLEPALFTSLNADTMEMYFERVGFDGALCQQGIDRAVVVLRALEARLRLPRAADEPEKFPCSWCRYVGECF